MLLHDDFEVWYGFREAAVPPPDHFEFEIHLGPDDCGEIAYRPDYPSDETPRWECRFHWPEERRSRLHALMVGHMVFDSRSVPPPDDDSAGGALESMEVRSDGRSFNYPWRTPGLVPSVVVEEVRSSVPAYVWSKLEEKQRAYGQT